MTIKILFIICYVICSSSSFAFEPNDNIHLQINYEQKQVNIPLKILNHKTVRPPSSPNGEFIIEDGIYCSNDGKYMEGLSHFKDKSGDKWELKFSSEKLSNDKYSIFSVILIHESEVQQQNDFSFKGAPVDILNCDVTPFSVIGLKTKKNEWFSLSLKLK